TEAQVRAAPVLDGGRLRRVDHPLLLRGRAERHRTCTSWQDRIPAVSLRRGGAAMKAKLSLFVSLLNLCVIVWYLATPWSNLLSAVLLLMNSISFGVNFTLFMVCNSEAY